MCGLAGIARLGGARFNDPDPDRLIEAMMDAVAHRGPDGRGITQVAGNVRLGFDRLSLVDLHTGGQPLVSDDESLLLIANGEVYNHRELAATLAPGTKLRTKSDCEVLLYLYRERGLRFLDDVHGMFSLVLWDRRANRLVMARDRFGIKPLFFHRNDDRILFASEIKALFEDPATPRSLDWEGALGDQLLNASARFSEAPLTSWFTDIVLVPSATILTVELASGDTSRHRYWELPTYAPDDSLGVEDFVREYRDRLTVAVRDCEMADVEVGLFLSGGVDSAAIAALAENRPHTFSALNASTLANGDAEYSVRIAAELGLANDQVLFDASSRPEPQQWLDFLWLLETPLAGPESFYKHEMYRYVRAATPSIKAMLLGGGADEFNGGYTTQFTDEGWPAFEAALQSMQLGAALDRRPELNSWSGPAGSLVRRQTLLDLGSVLATDAYEAFLRWKYRDVQQYNCWHEDRTAAGNGIEARVPFLDHRLIELGAMVPAALRPELVWDKQMLRRAVAPVLAPEYAQRPKIPFFYGPGVRHTYRAFGSMLLANNAELIERATATANARAYLDPDVIRSTAQYAVDQPTSGQLELLLRVVNLGLLDQLSSEPQPHHYRLIPSATAERVVVDDWATDATAVSSRVLATLHIDGDSVLELDDSVLLLHGDAESTDWFVLVDGQIMFVIDEIEDASWLGLLRALDGKRSVNELVGEDGFEALRELLMQAAGAELIGLALVAQAERSELQVVD
jgi:asparagine synthase (glutamine-hydrolysing)